MSSSFAVHKAIATALAADAAVVAEVGDRIETNPDASLEMPYITLNEVNAQAWDTQTRFGKEHLFDVHVWADQTHGFTKLYTAMMVVEDALREGVTALSDNHNLVLIRLTDSRTLRDPDGTLHGVMSFRAITQED